jgi:kynurenine formamidase
MHIYDITAPLSSALPIYPGDSEVTITPIAQLQWGDAANVSRLVPEFAHWDASRRATPFLRGGHGD